MQVVYDVRLAPYAREMRQWAASATTARLFQELQVLDEIVKAQVKTTGVSPKVDIAVHAVGDEIQRRIYGRYPADKFQFVEVK